MQARSRGTHIAMRHRMRPSSRQFPPESNGNLSRDCIVILSARRLHRCQRGVTLIEVLIVVAIMTLISTGVAIAVLQQWERARRETAFQNANAIRQGIILWKGTHVDQDCPSYEQLFNDGVLDENSAEKDPWGTPYKIVCTESSVRVVSSGKDRREGTEDDIVAPSRKARP